jgi:hypothetical protein
VIYFPSLFNKRGRTDENVLRIKRIRAKITNFLDPDAKLMKEIHELDKEILWKLKPSSWNVHFEHNLEKEYEVGFQRFAMNVAKQSGLQINSVTTFDFYAAVIDLTDKKDQ